MFRLFPIIWFPEEERGLVTASHAVFRYEDKVTALRHLKNAYEQLYDGLVPLDFNEEGCLVYLAEKAGRSKKIKDETIKIFEFKKDALLALRLLGSKSLLHHGNLMLCYYLTKQKQEIG